MTDLDELIEESRAIHDEFLKTIGKLEAFSEALSAQAGKLRDEIGSENARNSQTGNDTSHAPSPNPPGKRTDPDGGNRGGT